MGGVLKSLVVLLGPPVVLHAYGQDILILAYLFVINVTFGAWFWIGAAQARPGVVTAAAIYLLSGVLLFSLMVDPVGIETMTPERLRVMAGIDDPAETPDPRFRLAGSPAEHAEIHRHDSRPGWLDRLSSHIEAAMTRPSAN